jgi:hypothetical protein
MPSAASGVASCPCSGRPALRSQKCLPDLYTRNVCRRLLVARNRYRTSRMGPPIAPENASGRMVAGTAGRLKSQFA